eukprot:s1439_g7.t1
MEDAHVSVMRDSWGFFGVFDGHGGQQCSSFVAKRLTEELRSQALPADDEAVKSLMLRIDQEFLDAKQPSGSTGTFAFVVPSAEHVTLRVGNIGDSRVLLGRADGSMVEGPGTDGGLTTDHKPDNKVEEERIARTGGTVQTVMGVARVNGDLAVSRAFGDAQHKQTGGPAQEDHPVSAEPEFTTLTCAPSDFLLLVCDGISEGNFPNREVVRLAAEELRSKDPAQAAAAVCRKALDSGSMDNLSCMIVLLRRGEQAAKNAKKELWPGPFSEPTHGAFRKAYAAMAARAGATIEAAVEQRYTMASQQAREMSLRANKNREVQDAAGEKDKESENGAESLATMLWTTRRGQEQDSQDPAMAELRAELMQFDSGPPDTLAEGSVERIQWFKEWLDGTDVVPALDLQNMTRDELLNLVEEDPELLAVARAQGLVDERAMRVVRVVAADALRPAVEAHKTITWDDRLLSICEQRGKVLQDDPSDKTAQVKFRGKICANVWLPWECLEDEWMDLQDNSYPLSRPRTVQVAPVDVLQKAVEDNSWITWKAEMASLAGQFAIAIEDEPQYELVKVDFGGMSRYLPSSALLEADGLMIEDSEEEDDDDDNDSGFDDEDQSVKEVATSKGDPSLESQKRKPDDDCDDGSHKHQKC